jgi:tRNA threonylcarbamoyladenosine biosynthesis protein TsaB
MHVLALDTTTREGSVALVDQFHVIDERGGDAARSQAERLPGELVALADERHLPLTEIDLFAVASGPGSFTGLRIGIATIQGLALTTGRPIVAVSALEALAQRVGRDVAPGTVVAAWMDGRRHTVFAALYRVTDAAAFSHERLTELDGPTVDEPATTLARWADEMRGQDVVFTGDGATLYAGLLDGGTDRRWRIEPPPLLAGAIGRMAAARWAAGEAINPAAVHPLYVRRPDAETARDARLKSR